MKQVYKPTQWNRCTVALEGSHPTVVLKSLAPFRERLKVVAVESTYNWYWLVDGLMDYEYPAWIRMDDCAKEPSAAGRRGRRCS